MKIFLIWLCFILCGVANGYVCNILTLPGPFPFVIVLATSMIIFLLWQAHSDITRKWKRATDTWSSGHHLPLFGITTITALVAATILYYSHDPHKFWLTTTITVLVSNAVAAWKELEYTA